MTKIEDIEKKLYKEGDGEGKEDFRKIIIPETATEDEKKEVKRSWKELEAEERSRVRVNIRKIMKWAVVVGVAILLAIGVTYLIREWKFFEGDISLKVTSPASAKAGDFRKIEIIYQNRGRVNLVDAKIFISIPETAEIRTGPNYQFVKDGPRYRFDVGTILGKKDGKITLDMRFWGEEGNDQKVDVVLNYRPDKGTIFFDAKTDFIVKIEGSVFTLRISGPPHAVNNKKTDLFLEYANDGDTELKDVRVVVEYPEGFTFEWSDVKPSESNNIWDLETLGIGEVGKIQIGGLITGFDGETKNFKAYLGSKQDSNLVKYSKTSTNLTISSAILSIYQTVNEARNFMGGWGGQLSFRLQYKNTTSYSLRGVTIEANLTGDILDLESLFVDFGTFEYKKKKITWNSAGVPNLAVLGPGQGGQVSFRIMTKKSKEMAIDGPEKRNFTAKSLAKINIPSVPSSLGGVAVSVDDDVEVRIGTDVNLYTKGYYFDGPIENSGPIPPKVGETTTYTVEWQMVNSVNDVGDIKITSILPLYMRWRGNVSPLGERMAFDPETNVITWEIDKLNAGTGYYLPVRKVAFQVEITPVPSMVGTSPTIFSSSVLEGRDLFTDRILKTTDDPVSTNLALYDSKFTVPQWGSVVY
jgi:hypothetical protein